MEQYLLGGMKHLTPGFKRERQELPGFLLKLDETSCSRTSKIAGSCSMLLAKRRISQVLLSVTNKSRVAAYESAFCNQQKQICRLWICAEKQENSGIGAIGRAAESVDREKSAIMDEAIGSDIDSDHISSGKWKVESGKWKVEMKTIKSIKRPKPYWSRSKRVR